MRFRQILAGTLATGLSLAAILHSLPKLQAVLAADNNTNAHFWNATYSGANLNHPTGLYKFSSANGGVPSTWLVIADTGHQQIKLLTIGGGLTTLAGTGAVGNADGSGSVATFSSPTGVSAVPLSRYDQRTGQNSLGLRVSVNDTGNNSARIICVPIHNSAYAPLPCSTTTVTTLTTALSRPSGNAQDRSGTGFLGNSGDHTIYSRDTANNFSLIAGQSQVPGYQDGALNQAKFNTPTKVSVGVGSDLFVADVGNFVIRKVSNGIVSTYAGQAQRGYQDGYSQSAKFSLPTSSAYDPTDGSLYVTDSTNYCIRKISSSGIVSTYAGINSPGNVDGSLAAARFALPSDLVIDNHVMYVSDTSNNSIRKIDMASGQVSTLIR